MDSIVSLDNALLHQVHNIRIKYSAKIIAVRYASEAKRFMLQKKWDKLQNTFSRMLERENWEMVYKISGQQGEIIDECYSVFIKANQEIGELEKKRDTKIFIEDSAFEKLQKYYLFLVGKKDAEKPDDAL